eukprot:GILK01001513.1.p1 GENE.GILK01001513.1~~GILK01001513.1.p1  ORF type:complete len:393 (-),score=67.46 GILK01001513.1:171-1289(-)
MASPAAGAWPPPPPPQDRRNTRELIQRPASGSDTPRLNGRKRMSTNMTELMKKQVDDLRRRVLEYRVVSKRNNPSLDYSCLPNHVDLLIFGPAGSGKSSLIRTFYRALHNTATIPEEILSKIIVKETDQNEGTLLYTSVPLKESTTRRADVISGEMYGGTSAIRVHDTRGQIWMDSKELKQLEFIIQGRVKDMSRVEQRNYRYARLLWEFWRKDAELFPSDIVQSSTGLATRPHAIIFVFDGSMDDIPNGEEETQFYKDIIQMARERGYFYPQIVLTRIDKVEEQLAEYEFMDEFESEQRLREILDMKIENVVLKLGVSRSSVHFIENYLPSAPIGDLSIDYHVLRLLDEAIKHGDMYLQSNIEKRRRCVIQ